MEIKSHNITKALKYNLKIYNAISLSIGNFILISFSQQKDK